MDLPDFIRISPTVDRAMKEAKPIVALESAVFTHGLPYPENLETAMEVEERIRQEGAVPAGLAILDGNILVGLEDHDYTELAHRPGVEKFSNRDLGIAACRGMSGGLTVSASLVVAHKVGFKVFATGGIGGVHWDVDESLDISADLDEIARRDLIVVCSGAKSILDLGRTLEALETRGIPVIGYRTDSFPAFYHANSGFPLEFQVNEALELATLARIHWRLGNGTGLIAANPVPAAAAVSFSDLNAATQAALQEAKEREVSGKQVTPFLLRRLATLTEGASLVANRALLLDNCALAARIAVALGK